MSAELIKITRQVDTCVDLNLNDGDDRSDESVETQKTKRTSRAKFRDYKSESVNLQDGERFVFFFFFFFGFD